MSKFWQHPNVNIFKHFNIGEWKKCSKEGEVTTLMDKDLKGTVYRITGSIPASNFIQFPRTSTQSLGLTGRYLYCLFRPIPGKYFVVHVDVATDEGLTIRISFSNMFKEFKSTSTWLQFPFVSSPRPGSVDEVTVNEVSTLSSLVGSTSQTSRWTVLVLDLRYILSVYLNRQYSYLKNIRLCANMFIKGLFTSDIDYQPGISASEARKLGLLEQGISPMPREMAYPSPKGADWHQLYDYIKFPPGKKVAQFGIIANAKASLKTPKTVTAHDSPQVGRFRHEDSTAKLNHEPVNGNSQSGMLKEMNYRDETRQAVASRVALVDRLNPQKQASKKCRHVIPTTLPMVGVQRADVAESTSKGGEVHVYAHPRKVVTNLQRPKEKDKVPKDEVTLAAKAGNFKTLKPDPILSLKRVVGFGGGTFREALWTKNGSCIVYPCHAIIVSIEISSGQQQFFMGHTDKVSALAFDGRTDILASAQTGSPSVIRVWKYQTRKCAAMFRAEIHNVHCISLSYSGNILCGVGKDNLGKQMVVVWDISHAVRGGEVSIIAKAHTDVDICRMKIAEFDDTRLVSCGNDNIRFWRIRHGSLRSCPVDLGRQGSVSFTDIAYGAKNPLSADPTVRKVYSCTNHGTVYQLDYQKILLDKVVRLLPVGSRRDPVGKYGGTTPTEFGLSLNSICVNDSYCATGSDDGILRLWPLDFSTVFLEAEHEGPLTAVSISGDGLFVLAGTKTGNLGVLDVSARTYSTLMRSHTNKILAMSFDSTHRYLATVSADGSIRVWDLDTLAQLFDFRAPGEVPCAIAYHPLQQCFACGFMSGSVRVFHVGSTNLLAEHNNHSGQVTGLLFTPNGEFMHSAGALGSLALYNASDEGFQLIRFLSNTVATGAKFGPHLLSVSEDSLRLAFIGPSEYTVTVADARSLDEVLHVDISTITTDRSIVDTALHVCFSPSSLKQLLVVTSNARLLKLHSQNGVLLSEVSDIHRSSCSSLDVSRDGKHLATAGDRLVKIWDYHMRLDINFQVFIGHSDHIQQVAFTPDYLGVVSIGEAILLWDFHGRGRQVQIQGGREPQKSYISEAPDKSVRITPERPYSPARAQPHTVTPRKSVPVPTTYEPPQFDVSPIQVDVLDEDENSVTHEHVPYNEVRGHHSPKKSPLQQVPVDGNGHTSPTKTKSPARRLNFNIPNAAEAKLQKTDLLQPPVATKHYKRRKEVSTLPERRYTAPPNQAGLQLKSVLGYNGNGRKNMVWKFDTGLFAYTSGCIVVIEDLHSGTQRHLMGHTEEISTLALQHDGLILASASGPSDNGGSQICLWNIQSGICKKVLHHHENEIVCLAYARDDRFLVSVGDYRDCSIVVWCTRDMIILAASYSRQPVHDIMWDPYTASEFTSVGQEGSVLFWLLDETGGKLTLNVHEPEVPDELVQSKKMRDEYNAFTSLWYAGDSVMYAGTSTGMLSAWDTRQNKCFIHWEGDTTEIDVIIGHGGTLLVGSASGNLRLWSVVGVSEMRLPGETAARLSNNGLVMEDELVLDGAIISAAFDDALETGIIGTTSGTLWYVNWDERTSIRLVSGHAQQINDLTFSGPDDQYFATCSADGILHLWSGDNLEHLQFQVLGQTCNCVSFCPVPEATPTKSITNEGQTVATVHPHPTPPETVIQPSHCVAGYSDGTIRIFDLGKVEMIMKMQPHSASITAISFSADGRVIISGSEDGLLAISSPSTGLTVRLLNDHRGAPITCIHVSFVKDQKYSLPSPLLWLAASADRRVSVWSADWSKDFCELVDWLTFPAPPIGPDGKAIRRGDPAQYSNLPPSIAQFSPIDPDIVVYTGYGMQKVIQFYSLSHKKVVRTAALTQWAQSMDVSPKGHLIAIATEDRIVKLMDYSEGSFQDFLGHCGGVGKVRFSPSGDLLCSTSNTEVLMWNLKA
ncbi:WD repeat-containing protein 90-like isoform X2 [Montipora foliosa]|uniref:WD repeat-containing protein 90-like isoform X2 n=1 Tax=Montipora foliosa TaxID=591990 RepID=UPI0035F10F48